MSFKSKLYDISKELDNSSNNRNEFFQKSVEERLNYALINYNKEISQSYNYLSTKNGINVLKKLNRCKE